MAGCRDDEDADGPKRGPPLPAAGPEEPGRFLNEPAGVPPDPLVPMWAQVRIRVASEPAKIEGALGKLSGLESTWPAGERTEVDAFLARNQLWYAKLNELGHYVSELAAGHTPALPEGVEPNPPIAELGGATLTDIQSLRRDELLALVKAGARGNLVLWYPVKTLRKRLTGGGRAGVWRGITRLRESLPGKGPKLGGTPVLIRAAVTQLDARLVEDALIPGFRSRIDLDVWVHPKDESRRRELLAKLGPAAPTPPSAAPRDLPEAWRSQFRAPDGTPVVWLIPKETNVMSDALDQAVEGLMPVIKQGGKAWILIALPLAEEYKPERFK